MDKDKDCRVEQLTTPSKLHNRYVFADVNEIRTTHLYVFLESCVAGLGKSLQKSNSLFLCIWGKSYLIFDWHLSRLKFVLWIFSPPQSSIF